MELFYIWLECIKGLGPSGWHAVLDEFNNPYDVYINKKELVPQGRITPNHVKLIKENAEDALERAKAIVENCKRHNISIIKYDDQQYKNNIREYADFPVVFYYKGRFSDNWTNGVGIVGARRCTLQHKETAINITSEMVKKKYPIISGLAKGIDSYAHTAAIYQDGYTIAVLGFGIDQCYPVEHQKLKCAIAENGLLISEYPPGTPPSEFRFPRRNRIIAGLSDVLYVVGVKEKSGTRTTIQAAERYKKEILIYS